MKEPKSLKLANIPTPLIDTQFEGCKFKIKRDDFTGMELSGNKVRKLEYLLYEAKRQKVDYVFTSGGDQSNHARATCIAANTLGIKSKLFLWGKDKKIAEANLFFDKLTNAEIEFFTKAEYSNVSAIMEKQKIKYQKKGKKVFVIPSGGSSTLGIWGYINFMKELAQQTNIKKLKGIVVAAGTGGTAAGLLIGATLLGLNNFKIFPVNVIYSEQEIRNKIITLVEQCIVDFKINIKPNFNNIKVLDGYSTEGYKNVTQKKVKIINSYFNESGILLDPIYTGKAFVGFYENFLKDKKSSNVMFLHTGGLFGTFAKRKDFMS
jgi:D-cysteine desulfhydrase